MQNLGIFCKVEYIITMSKLQKLLVIAFEYVHFIWIYVETDQQIKRFTLAIGQKINEKI